MGSMSDKLEFYFASHLLGSGAFAKPSTVAVALTATVPTDASTGATIPELANTGAYARQTSNPSASNWTDPIAANGICYNLATITFPQATADWGWVSGVALCSSATYGAGDVYIWGSLTTPKNVGSGDQLRLPISGITITFD